MCVAGSVSTAGTYENLVLVNTFYSAEIATVAICYAAAETPLGPFSQLAREPHNEKHNGLFRPSHCP
jgi:hypothetical protein